MSIFAMRFPGMKAGEYEEFGIPGYVLRDMPDRMSVRMFATPSVARPLEEGYYLQAMKDRKAGWGNGSAFIMCSCMSSMFRFGLVLTGMRKTPCKHAVGLRALLRGKPKARAKIRAKPAPCDNVFRELESL